MTPSGPTVTTTSHSTRLGGTRSRPLCLRHRPGSLPTVLPRQPDVRLERLAAIAGNTATPRTQAWLLALKSEAHAIASHGDPALRTLDHAGVILGPGRCSGRSPPARHLYGRRLARRTA